MLACFLLSYYSNILVSVSLCCLICLYASSLCLELLQVNSFFSTIIFCGFNADELRYQIDYEYHHPYSSFNSYFLGRKIVDKTLSFLFIRLFLNYNQPYKHQNVIFRLAFSRIFIILIFKKSLGSSHYPNIIPADCIYD